MGCLNSKPKIKSLKLTSIESERRLQYSVVEDASNLASFRSYASGRVEYL
jgi:hypothetical protein